MYVYLHIPKRKKMYYPNHYSFSSQAEQNAGNYKNAVRPATTQQVISRLIASGTEGNLRKAAELQMYLDQKNARNTK